MEEAIKVCNELKEKGLIKDYAIGGGIAAIFYVEPLLTYDLDIFFIPSGEESLSILSPIYDYLRQKGYSEHKEHIIVGGIPVQFIPVYNELIEEAVKEAVSIEYKDIETKVVRAEYLVAIMLQTSRPKDKERIVRFLDEEKVDMDNLTNILRKHKLEEKFKRLRRLFYEE